LAFIWKQHVLRSKYTSLQLLRTIGNRFPAGARILLFITSIPALRPLPTSAAVENAWSFTSTPRLYIHSMVLR